MKEKEWIIRAKQLLHQSLLPASPHELNELDWKRELTPNLQRFAEHISAFANMLKGGFLVFGIDQQGHKIGVTETECKKIITKLGNTARDGVEPLCIIDHHFEVLLDKDRVLVFVYIEESAQKPVHLRGKSLEFSFIRSAGQTRKMSPAEIRTALLHSRTLRFEELTLSLSDSDQVINDMDIEPVATRLKKPFSGDAERRNELLVNLKFAAKTSAGLLPTYLGILIAGKDFKAISGCEHYGVRLTRYKGITRMEADYDKFYLTGFTHSFDRIIEDVVALLPKSEVIEKATRRQMPIYPEIALRELVANAVIHRDYSRTDSYVQVEVFEDRIEITNPGTLLPEMTVDRLIDQQPRARNEVLAAIMRELGFCEERGSGIDKTASSLEFYGLPAVHFINNPDSFRAILYSPRPYKTMENEERLRTAYQHTCLHYAHGQKVTNASLRTRLKLSESQSQLVSTLLRRCIDMGQIKVANPTASPRYVHYLPYWA